MSTISQNLSSLVAAKSAIASAINAKGGTATGGLSNYASCIQAIPQSQEVVDLAPGTKFGNSSFSAIPAAYMSYISSTPNLRNMFQGCGYLLEPVSISNSTATIGDHMFYDCQALRRVDINLPRVNDWSYMFCRCYNLSAVSLGSITHVTNLESCFSGCRSLTSISLDIPAVLRMHECFEYCSALTSVTLNTSLTSSMYMCFCGCSSLKSVDLNLPTVTDMRCCFSGCSRLTSISLDLPTVTDMQCCFSGCRSLTSVSLTNLTNVKYMSGCFSGCSTLTSISLDLPAVTNMDFCFFGCVPLYGSQELGLTSVNLNIPAVTSVSYCFCNCSNLNSISICGLSNITGNWNLYECFSHCSSLENVYFDALPEFGLENWRISSSSRLTHDSLLNIVNALPTATGARKCTVGTTNLTRLSDDEKAIATNKGWTLN